MSSGCIFFKNLTDKPLVLESQSARLYRLDPFTGVYRELRSTTIGSGESVRCMLSFAKENVIEERLIKVKMGRMFFRQLLSAVLLKGESFVTDASISQSKIYCRLYTDGQGDNVMLFSYSEGDIFEFIREKLTDIGMGARLRLSNSGAYI